MDQGFVVWFTGLPGAGKSTLAVQLEAVLRARGHNVRRDKGGFGGYQGILIDPKHGTLQGGTEVRNDGAAVGY